MIDAIALVYVPHNRSHRSARSCSNRDECSLWDIYRVVRLGLGELLRRMRTHRDIDVVDLVHTLFAATLNGDQRGSSGRT